MISNFRRVIVLLLCLLLVVSSCLGVIVVSANDTSDYKSFLQTDARWSNVSLGGSSDYTIGSAGCAVTSVTMLMAFANSNLRDVNTFNPATTVNTLAPGGPLSWGNATLLDSTFTLVEDNRSVSNPLEKVVDSLNKGYYVIIYTPKLVDPVINYPPTQHYSPIVGIKDGKPQVWDVGVGLYNDWDVWVDCGITQIVVYKSSLSSSKDTLEGFFTSSPMGLDYDNKKEAWGRLVKEQELVGMGNDFKFQVDVSLPGYDSLTNYEKNSLESIKGNILENKSSWFDYLRVGVSFIGLFVVVYGILLIIAFVFDGVNNILDISLLSFLTLGKYRVWDDSLGVNVGYSESDGYTYCDVKFLVSRVFVIEVIGFLLISNVIFDLLYKLLINLSII